MNKNTTHPKNVRPATTATPQGNIEPKLLDKDGQPKAAVAPVEAFPLLDLSLFNFDIPSESDGDDILASIDPDSGSFGKGLSFTRYAILEAREKAAGNLQAYADYCDASYKGLKKAAEALIAPHMEEYFYWLQQFKGAGTIHLVRSGESAGASSVNLDDAEFDRSAKAIAYAMAKISNSLLFGKAATESKPKVESIFYNPRKVAKLGGFEGTNGKLRAMAEVNHLIVDEAGEMEYLFTTIGEIARFVLHHNQVEATDKWRKLTGQVVADKRVVINSTWARNWIQARMYGSLAAMFAEESRKTKDEKFKLTLSDAEASRVAEYRRNIRIALNKAEDTAQDTKPETIAGSKVEAPDTRATLPTAMVEPKTAEEIERNAIIKRAGRMAEAEMNAAITRGELKADDLEACQKYWEAANIRILAESDATITTDDNEVEEDSEAAETESTESAS